MPIVLETVGLMKRFAGIVPTNTVSLQLEKGSRHAMSGPLSVCGRELAAGTFIRASATVKPRERADSQPAGQARCFLGP